MTIYSRFGDPCKLVRFATVKDVKEYEKRKADKQDRERTKEGWRFICEWIEGAEAPLVGKDFLADGIREILNAAEALTPRPEPLPPWLAERLREKAV